jgi:DNA-binding MarR family transcriptional regulator
VKNMMTQNETHWNLFRVISGIYVKSRRMAEKWLKPLNMTWPQFGAMLNLSQGDGITQRELAEKMEADSTTVMVLCDSLEKKGWMNRTKDPSDRRVNRLILTEEGRETFAEAYPLMLSGYQLFVQVVSQENLKTVLPILEELYGHISEYYQKEIGSR